MLYPLVVSRINLVILQRLRVQVLIVKLSVKYRYLMRTYINIVIITILEACQFLIFITQHDVQCSLRVDQAFHKIDRTNVPYLLQIQKIFDPRIG